MSRASLDKTTPNPIDTYVGTKVKTRRLMLGLSQDDLASAIGLTFQQVQKYEKGTNRISVSRLIAISHALKVPFGYFLDGCSTSAASKHAGARGVADNKQETLSPDPLSNKDVMDLVRAYSSINTPQLKKQLLEMAKAMATTKN